LLCFDLRHSLRALFEQELLRFSELRPRIYIGYQVPVALNEPRRNSTELYIALQPVVHGIVGEVVVADELPMVAGFLSSPSLQLDHQAGIASQDFLKEKRRSRDVVEIILRKVRLLRARARNLLRPSRRGWPRLLRDGRQGKDKEQRRACDRPAKMDEEQANIDHDDPQSVCSKTSSR